MTSPIALAPDELPSPRSESVSSTAEYLPDLEKQTASSSELNRPDTWSHSSCTTFAKSLPRRNTLLSNGQLEGAPRRDTGFSTATSSFSPGLERRQTWKIEEEALHGYPQLAAMLGTEDNYAIYRRFAALNARNLLYHQAKLIHLEHQLHDLELMHGQGEHEELHYKIEHLFSDEKYSDEHPGRAIRAKYEEISRALDKYNQLLLNQARLHELPKPDATFVDSIWNYLHLATTKKPGWLQHPENTAYAVDERTRKPLQSDLVTLNRAFKQQDMFTRFFTGTFLDWWHRVYSKIRKPDGDHGEYIYGDGKVSMAMRAFVMVIASALPTCSIVALYFIQSPIWRLIFVVLFSGVFACALTIFTEARSIDVFTASVALASVQVVFVGTAFGNGANSDQLLTR